MSVEGIAAATGVSKPTIYRRWPTKAALAVAACEDLRLHGLPEPTGDLTHDLVAQLRDLRKHFDQSHGMPLVESLLADELQTPRLLGLFRARVVTPYSEAILARLAEAQDRGEVRADADLDAAVNMLVGAYYAQYASGQPFRDDWAQTVVASLLEGVGA
jgi:AcrR family transcriptional regulator